VEELAADEGGRHEQHTATTATHRRTDGQVDRLTWSNIVVRPCRETGAAKMLAKLSYDGSVLRTVSDEHVILEDWRTRAFNDAQLPQLRVK